MEIETASVVGSGLMGAGIVEACARSSHDIVVRERRNQLWHPKEPKPELLARAPDQVWSWE
jgi:3-hydroxyacyl-CoA dehydrogenase|tara:strand:- start:1378 stop:1560 length:183 start_codon:yes stop_codon:yes gene_type:complete